jgi:hypothetical protein
MTLKERYNKIKKAATQFWNENKDILIVAGSFLAGTFVTYKIMKNATPINEIAAPQVNYTPPVYTPPANDTTDNIVPWDEETMRDNWDWVCELASNMELEPGESYYIENAVGSHGDAGASIGSNYVCHMYDGEEVYPDDVEEYEEMYDPDNTDNDEDEEEDDEDDADKYIEIQVNEDDPAVKDIARKFVALINTNAVSVRRKEND